MAAPGENSSPWPSWHEGRRFLLWRGTVVIVTIVGLALALQTMLPFSSVAVRRLAETLGWAGFCAYLAYSSLVFGLLGAAWSTVMGQGWAALPAFAWARMLREAASDLLPFSQIGGIVIGADSLIDRGYSAPSVYASMTADLTTEMASQALFTSLAIGLSVEAWDASVDTRLQSVVLVSLAAIVLLTIAALSAPQWIARFAPLLLERLAPGALANVDEMVDRLRRMYRNRRRIVASIALNFSAWTMSAAGAWVVLLCMGSDFPLLRVLSLEAFVFALRSVAFMVPAGIGVQEAGYAILAPMLGLPSDQVVVLALTKRGKDLALGLPTLLVWQWREARNLTRAFGRRKVTTSAKRNAR